MNRDRRDFMNRSGQAVSPPCKGGVAAASIIKSRSHRSAADGVVNHKTRFKTHSATYHPVRAFSERDHFFMARPPLLSKEGKAPRLNTSRFIHVFSPCSKNSLVPIFLLQSTRDR